MRGLTFRAEVVMGGLLVARHRSYRLAVALAFALFATAGLSEAGVVAARTMLVAAGSLGAVAGTRLLCPGAALGSVRWVAAAWWLPPTGRLFGAALFVAPVVGAGALGLVWPDAGWGAAVLLGGLCLLFAATWAACTLALAPLLGAGGAGALGLLAVWLGGIPPSAVHRLLDGVGYVQRPAVLLWNVLPLGWRAARASTGVVGDWAVLVAWLAGGVMVAAWAAGRPIDGGTRGEGTP